MKQMKRVLCFAGRCAKEIARDPLTLFFGLLFPLLLLLLMTLINSNIPIDLFAIGHLAPGVAVFGLSFITLFTALLVSRDRDTAFLRRLFSAPLRAQDFLLGYLLPLLPMALAQTAIVYLAALALGLTANVNVLLAWLAGLIPALFYLALGLLMGTLLNTQQVGGVCGALLTNLSAWLSGVWFDIGLLGGAFGKICKALPFWHAVEACRGAVNGENIVTHLLVVAAYAIVLLIAACWLFARRMKKGI